MFISPASSPQLRSTLHLLIHPLTGTPNPPTTHWQPPSLPLDPPSIMGSWPILGPGMLAMKYLKRKISQKNKAWLLYDQISSILICHSLVSAGTSPLLLVTAELLIPRPAKRKYENRQNRILEDMYYVILCISFTWHNSVWIWFWGWTNIWGYRHQSLYLVERTVTFIFW